MAFYYKLGNLPERKHTTFYKEDGKSLYREELVSALGFSGHYSNKYHLYMPSRISKVEEANLKDKIGWEDAPIEYYHFDTDKKKTPGNFITARDEYLTNPHCKISVAHITENTENFFRNAYAHEIVFIHFGTGEFRSDYGRQTIGPGDQIVIPKGTIYQLKFNDLSKAKILVFESDTPYEIPKTYRNPYGQLEEHAPYCERDLRPPEYMKPVDQLGDFTLIAKMGDRYFKYTLDHHPFDVVGWDGYLFPFVFNWKSFNPKVGKIHLPPPVHIVFTTKQFVYCNFCPRPFDFDDNAIPAPYAHYNIDSDEVLYYVEGDFMSRKGIKEGSITLHPTGLTHAPQPGKTEEAIGKKATKEFAIMVDTFSPLYVTRNVKETMYKGYSQSWLEK